MVAYFFHKPLLVLPPWVYCQYQETRMFLFSYLQEKYGSMYKLTTQVFVSGLLVLVGTPKS